MNPVSWSSGIAQSKTKKWRVRATPVADDFSLIASFRARNSRDWQKEENHCTLSTIYLPTYRTSNFEEAGQIDKLFKYCFHAIRQIHLICVVNCVFILEAFRNHSLLY